MKKIFIVTVLAGMLLLPGCRGKKANAAPEAATAEIAETVGKGAEIAGTAPEKNYDPAVELTPFAVPQEYSGEIPFEKSENVRVEFYMSADATRITKIRLTMDDLYLDIEGDAGFEGMQVASMNIMDAGLTLTDSREIVDGKITSDALLTFDLTVTDACIYGTMGFRFDREDGSFGVAEDVYVVIPNTTTPQDIPESILYP